MVRKRTKANRITVARLKFGECTNDVAKHHINEENFRGKGKCDENELNPVACLRLSFPVIHPITPMRILPY